MLLVFFFHLFNWRVLQQNLLITIHFMLKYYEANLSLLAWLDVSHKACSGFDNTKTKHTRVMLFTTEVPRCYGKTLALWNSAHATLCYHGNISKLETTQRAQTSLAEADHYSHISHCKNVEPWLWKTTHPLKKKKKKKKVLDHYLHGDLDMLPLLQCFFCSFTHLTIPRSPPKFNQFFLVLLRTRP